MDNLPETQNQPIQPLAQTPAPTQPGPPPPSSSPRAFLKSILVIVMVAVVTSTLGFGILNYFNIIKLDFLPHRSNSQSLATKTPTQKFVFPCPLKVDPCPKPEIITQHSNKPNFRGLGYNGIASGSAVIALLDGKLTEQSTATGSTGQSPILDAKIEGKDLRANYQSRGTAAKEAAQNGKPISQQEILAVLGNEQLGKGVYGKLYNLIIFVQDREGRFIKLQPTKDGQGLETTE